MKTGIIEKSVSTLFKQKTQQIEQMLRFMEIEMQIFKCKLAKKNLTILNLLKVVNHLEEGISRHYLIFMQNSGRDSVYNFGTGKERLKRGSLIVNPRTKTVERSHTCRNPEADLKGTVKPNKLVYSEVKVSQSYLNSKINSGSVIMGDIYSKNKIEPLFEIPNKLEESLLIETDNMSYAAEFFDIEKNKEELKAKYMYGINENIIKCLAFHKIVKAKVKINNDKINGIFERYKTNVKFEQNEANNDLQRARRLVNAYTDMFKENESIGNSEFRDLDQKSLDRVIEQEVIKFKYNIYEKELHISKLKREIDTNKQTEAELLHKLIQTKQLLVALEEKHKRIIICPGCKRKFGSERTSLQISENKIDISHGDKSFVNFERLSLDYDRNMASLIEDMNSEIQILNMNNDDLIKKLRLNEKIIENYKQRLTSLEMNHTSEIYYYELLVNTIASRTTSTQKLINARTNTISKIPRPFINFTEEHEPKIPSDHNWPLMTMKPKSKSLLISNIQVQKDLMDLLCVDGDFVQKEFIKFKQNVQHNKIWYDQIIDKQTYELNKLSNKLEESSQLNRELNSCLVENTRILKDMNDSKEKRIKELEEKLSMYQSCISIKTQKHDLKPSNSDQEILEKRIKELQEANDKLKADTIVKKITIVNLYKRYEKLFEEREADVNRLTNRLNRLTTFCEKILVHKISYDSKMNKFKKIIKWVMTKFDDIKSKGLDQLYNLNNKILKTQEDMIKKFKLAVRKYQKNQIKLYEYHKVLAEISTCLDLDFYNIKFKDLSQVLKDLKNRTRN